MYPLYEYIKYRYLFFKRIYSNLTKRCDVFQYREEDRHVSLLDFDAFVLCNRCLHEIFERQHLCIDDRLLVREYFLDEHDYVEHLRFVDVAKSKNDFLKIRNFEFETYEIISCFLIFGLTCLHSIVTTTSVFILFET